MSSNATLSIVMAAGLGVALGGCATPLDVERSHGTSRELIINNDNTNAETIIDAVADAAEGRPEDVRATLETVRKRNEDIATALAAQREQLDAEKEAIAVLFQAIGQIAGSVPAAVAGNFGGFLSQLGENIPRIDAALRAGEDRDQRAADVREAIMGRTMENESRVALVSSRVETLDGRLDKLGADLAERVREIRSDTSAIRDLEARIATLPNEAAVRDELDEFLGNQGLSQSEIARLKQEFSLAEILALLGVGGGAVAGSRVTSRSKERIDEVGRRVDELRNLIPPPPRS